MKKQENKKNIGTILKKLRKEKDYTLEQLSNLFNEKYAVGTSKGMISNWEHEKNEPTTNSLKMYAELFNVSMDYLTELTKKKRLKDIEPNEKEINNLNELQKQKLDNFVKSNTLMFFSGNKELTEEQKESIDKSLSKAFIEILKDKGEIK